MQENADVTYALTTCSVWSIELHYCALFLNGIVGQVYGQKGQLKKKIVELVTIVMAMFDG